MPRFYLFGLAVLLLSACTPTPPEPGLLYQDPWLCFTVEVPKDWYVDGVPGGFAAFGPGKEHHFTIAQGSAERLTLESALESLRRGSVGPFIQEINDFVVNDQPALWVTLQSSAKDYFEEQFQFVVLVIAPDCGDGPHALFISANAKADQRSFEIFLNQVRFIYETIEPFERAP